MKKLLLLLLCYPLIGFSQPAYNPTGIININNSSKSLIKITDVLGQDTKEKANTTLFYIYDDGKVQKRIIIE